MAPKKAKTAEAPQAGEETAPMSLDDLPNDVLGIILGKLKFWKDKIHLTQASPSVRRICTGPHAHPGVLGSLALGIDSKSSSAGPLHLEFDGWFEDGSFWLDYDIVLWLDPEHEGFDEQAGPFLSWIESHALAFKDITLFLNRAGTMCGQDRSRIPSTVLSILNSVPASFRGPLRLSLDSFFDGNASLLRPIFDLISSRFSSNANELFFESSDFESPEVCSLVREISSFKKLSFTSFEGELPPDAFIYCAPIDSLTLDVNVDDPEEDTSSGFVACTSFKTIRSFEIRQTLWPRGYFDFSVFLTADFSSLQSVTLNPVHEDELPKLSGLESLPDLSYLSVITETYSSEALSKFSISLPKLNHLKLGFSYASNFRLLESLSCPNLRILEITVDVYGLSSVSVECLEHLPLLTYLGIHAKSSSAADAPCTIALSSDQVRHNPLLAFASVTAAGEQQTSTVLSVDLPLPLNLSTEGKEENRYYDRAYVKRLQFGDGRAREEFMMRERLTDWAL